jgi:hypothetical protein
VDGRQYLAGRRVDLVMPPQSKDRDRSPARALALTEPEAGVRLQGGLAPVGRFLLQLIDLVWNGTIDPGKVFDLALPLD